MIYFGLKPIAKFLRSNNKRLGFAGGMGQIISQLFANNEQGFAFDFNDLSTMYQDAAGTIPVTGVGQPVGKVLDKSGRGNHATQSTSAKRPILQQNATTGAYYLAFDGVDDFLMTNSFNLNSDEVSLFLAIRKLNDRGQNTIIDYGFFNSNSFGVVVGGAGGSESYTSASSGSMIQYAIFKKSDDPSFNAPNSSVLSVLAKISTSSNILRLNGRQKAINTSSQGTGNYTARSLFIGSLQGAQYLFNGHLYSLIGVARLATPTEITNTENTITKNVGVTL